MKEVFKIWAFIIPKNSFAIIDYIYLIFAIILVKIKLVNLILIICLNHYNLIMKEVFNIVVNCNFSILIRKVVFKYFISNPIKSLDVANISLHSMAIVIITTIKIPNQVINIDYN